MAERLRLEAKGREREEEKRNDRDIQSPLFFETSTEIRHHPVCKKGIGKNEGLEEEEEDDSLSLSLLSLLFLLMIDLTLAI